MKDHAKFSIFIILAFILPLVLTVLQYPLENEMLSFVLYGMQAASPTVSAVVVLAINRDLKEKCSELLSRKNTIKAIVYPVAIVCVTMFLSKLLFCFLFRTEFEMGRLSGKQLVIVLWALVAEEFGWRGFLEPLLNRMWGSGLLTPCIVGIIWSLWHYHYFLQNRMDAPIVWFVIGCVAESYIYSYLLRRTEGNILSAMIYHFMWNLMLHIFALGPSENNGNAWPYIILIGLELLAAFYIIVRITYDEKKRS